MSCKVSEFKLTPKQARQDILTMAYNGKSGHIGCALSIVEIILALYSEHLKLNTDNPKDPSRDYFVLSKGHGVMALYVCLAHLKIIPSKHIDNYFQDGTPLHGLGEYGVAGIEASGGSLGHGICVAQGIAYGLKKRNSSQRVFSLVGDGEINEGSFWETILFSAHNNLNNLTVIVDANGFQAMGRTSEILELESFVDKFESFGFFAINCDGHNIESINDAIKDCKESKKPSVIIARTIKGKGVSFFENNNEWHYQKMNENIYLEAMKELSI